MELTRENLRNFYELEVIRDRFSRTLRTSLCEVILKFKDLSHLNLIESLEILEDILNDCVTRISEKCEEADYVRFVLEMDRLETPIQIPYLKLESFDASVIMDRIECVLQSHEFIGLDDQLKITFVRTEYPGTGGRTTKGITKSRGLSKIGNFIKNKRCLMNIPDIPDGLCSAVALIIAKKVAEKSLKWNKNTCDNLKKSRIAKSRIIEEAISLKKQARLSLLNDVGVDQFAKYQAVMKDFNIFVHSAQLYGNVVFKPSHLIESRQDLHIILVDEHFIACNSMPALLSTDSWCRYCLRGTRKEHHCTRCQLCHSSKCTNRDIEPSDYRECNKCNRTFLTDECFRCHTIHSCHLKKKCLICNKVVKASLLYNYRAHHCNQRFCRVCKSYVNLEHSRSCFIQPVECSEKTDPTLEPILLFYDVESAGSQYGEHEPILICAQDEFGLKKEFLGGNNKCVDDFMAWIDEYKKFHPKRELAVLAHAAGFYDNVFILKYCIRHKIKVNVLIRSNRLLLMSFSTGIKFLDTYSYMPMKLSKIATCFDLKEKKGYCPFYCLNSDLTIKASEQKFFPDKRYFPIDSYTNSKEREAFETWYHEESNFYIENRIEYPVILKTVEYCMNDVDMLREACLKLRTLFRELTNGQCIFVSITLTSAVWRAYRNLYLTKDTIAYIPPKQYCVSKNFSQMSNSHLLYKSYETGWPIEFALTSGERKIGPYWVDGYYQEPNGQAHIFSFEGSFWHSTNTSYNLDDIHPVLNVSHGENLQKMIERHAFLKQYGKLHVMHENVWQSQLKNNPRISIFLERLDLNVKSLEPIEVVYGGRVENFVLYHECDSSSGEHIAYYDVNSLYPYVNLITEYPIGHPVIIHGSTLKTIDEWTNYFGVIKVRVLPPQNLYIPVLPCKIDGKLIFCLCHLCAKQRCKTINSCKHSDLERSWIATYTTPELAKATSLGYRILKIYQIYHFPNKSKIFESFIKHFYAIKLQSQGPPAWVQSDEDLMAYCKQIKDQSGIELDPHKIVKNDALREEAKSFVVSAWAKSLETNLKRQVTFCTTYAELIQIIANSNIIVNDICFVNDDVCMASYHYTEDAVNYLSPTPVNIITGAWTLSHARLVLYSYSEKFPPNSLLYCDTDSVIVKSNHEIDLMMAPYVGQGIGQLKNEIPEGYRCTGFNSTSPKSYSMKLTSLDGTKTQTILKAKGFKLTSSAREQINYESFKQLILSNESNDAITVKNQPMFKRDLKAGTIKSVYLQKRLKVNADKRCSKITFSHPYGYVENQ